MKQQQQVQLSKNSVEYLTNAESLTPIIDRIGERRIVMCGEASHGTHEYYIWRQELARRLIKERGFNMVVVEGDWPDLYEMNQYAKHVKGATFGHSLRWPSWMWYNAEFRAFVEWIRKYNEGKPPQDMVSIYGFDIYALWQSLNVLDEYFKKSGKFDDKIKQAFDKTINCFEPFNENPEKYSQLCSFVDYTCEKEVKDLVNKLSNKRMSASKQVDECLLSAEMNALSVLNAEHYYRQLIQGKENTWNIRDTAMVDCLDRLMKFQGSNAKAVIFAHNTHIGDSSATSMKLHGDINVGEMVRKRWPGESYAVGFGSFKGSVIAARSWGDKWAVMPVPPAIPSSWEDLISKGFNSKDVIIFSDENSEYNQSRGHRAIGVVFHPERQVGNFVSTNLAKRYNAFIYIHETKALHPLPEKPDDSRMPETYPFGF